MLTVQIQDLAKGQLRAQELQNADYTDFVEG